MMAQAHAAAAFGRLRELRAASGRDQPFSCAERDAGELAPGLEAHDAIGAELLRERGLRDVGVLLVS